jgi:3-phosphoglycerate kinase
MAIAKLAREEAKVVVLSHLGRPKGTPTPDTPLKLVAAKMQELMPGTAVRFAAAHSGDDAKRVVDALKPGEVTVLENVRYHKGE